MPGAPSADTVASEIPSRNNCRRLTFSAVSSDDWRGRDFRRDMSFLPARKKTEHFQLHRDLPLVCRSSLSAYSSSFSSLLPRHSHVEALLGRDQMILIICRGTGVKLDPINLSGK